MNDPNKRIDVNLSSLISLKAELLRKQEEVNRIKKPTTLDPSFIQNRGSLNRGHRRKKNDEIPPPQRVKTEDEKRIDEDHEMLARSKKALEAKAKLYANLTNSGGFENSDDTCLVRFNKKKQDVRRPVESSSSSESESDTDIRLNDNSDDDDSTWTEYTDCLGRTRKCHKDDLEFFKKKDRELAEATKNRNDRSEERETPYFVDTKGISSADLPLYKATDDDDTMSMMSKVSKMDEMRVQWEHKEQDNLNRDQIHYQDVLFDEARTHGVGYYSFSTDATERIKQQKVLEKDREKTLEEQKKREELRLARERMTKERVFAAKNRQRARQGLPPLSRDELDSEGDGDDKDGVEESKSERKRRKREEKERRKKEKLEKEREEQRQIHLRPWDQGKDMAPHQVALNDEEKWEYKPEKPEPMSQNQWNDMKRAERNPDFAPPQSLKESFNRFTTIKPKPIKRRNETAYKNKFNEPIRNELDGDDFPIEQDETNKRRRAEIAPPPTFDYYGPSTSSKPKVNVAKADISESIEAGLRFLRDKSDKDGLGTKQSWVANTTYEG